MDDKEKIVPIILTGGSGSRLWPLSRKTYAKQYIKLFDNQTLFQKTVLRYSGKSYHPPVIVTNDISRFIIKNQLNECSINNSDIIIEPVPKNTAAAALLGILHAKKILENPFVLISPSDHFIKKEEFLNDLIFKAKKDLPLNKILLFGIKPTNPNTGYGWIDTNLRKENKKVDYLEIKNFIEKPKLNLAKKLFESKSSFWNSGIFFGRAQAFIQEFCDITPKLFQIVKDSYVNSYNDLEFVRIRSGEWQDLADISIDMAIIEKTKNKNVIPFKGLWSDVGSWDSLMKQYPSDNKNNVSFGNVSQFDSENSLFFSSSNKIHLLGIGLKDIITVATEDAVLVLKKEKNQDVKKSIEKLRDKKIEQADSFLNDFRPWGNFEIISKGKNFLVKKIFVNPKSRLSLQSHKFRSEHWVVVKGKAKVTLDNETFYLSENESTYVNTGVVHRLENDKNDELIIIEVQTGSYLGEDDILRFEDDYKR